jgi:hypothetical protein
MSSQEARAAAAKLVEMARGANVDLPTDTKVAMVSAGQVRNPGAVKTRPSCRADTHLFSLCVQVLLMHKKGNDFDLDAALTVNFLCGIGVQSFNSRSSNCARGWILLSF